MEWYWILIILLIVILILWWALRKNASETEKPASHVEEEPVKKAEPVVVETRTAQSVQAVADDLKLIEGIGPKISSILKEAGISTFAQLAKEDPARLKGILEAAGLRLNDPTSWPEQARLAAEGKMEDLQKLQDQLKGGRILS